VLNIGARMKSVSSSLGSILLTIKSHFSGSFEKDHLALKLTTSFFVLTLAVLVALFETMSFVSSLYLKCFLEFLRILKNPFAEVFDQIP